MGRRTSKVTPLRTRHKYSCLVLLSLTIEFFRTSSADLCVGSADGRRFSHPDKCNWFIECRDGRSISRKCNPLFEFSGRNGVCDQRDGFACNLNSVLSKSNFHPKDALRVASQDLRRSYSDGEDSNRKPFIFDETVHGLRSHHEDHLPSDVSEKDLVAYWSAVTEEARQSTLEHLRQERTWSKKLRDVMDSYSFRGVSNFLKTRPYAKTISRSAISVHRALQLLRKRFRISGLQLLNLMRKLEITTFLKPLQGSFHPDTTLPAVPDVDYCPFPETIQCPTDYSSKRSVDGSCNNRLRPIIGRSMTPFRRLVPAKYYDGIGEPRRSVTGAPLPGARRVSLTMFADVDRPSPRTTMAFVFFGQFTDHDLTRTALSTVTETDPDADADAENVTQVKCGADGCLTGPGLEACLPIPVPFDDPDFSHNNRCLKFVRNMEVPSLDCQIGSREQLNQVTHWLDASQVYGSTKDEEKLLKDSTDSKRGRLAVVPHPNGRSYKPLLPKEVVSPAMPSECKHLNETIFCLQAGDPRVNENLGLSMMHVVLVRHHNSIEEDLHLLNPEWSGERLYRETRRILIASLQHITFNEWLPLLLGPNHIRRFELDLVADGYYRGYDPKLDARIPNAFAAAAFRIGHTLLQGKLHRIKEHKQPDENLFLSETFNKPQHIYDTHSGGVDALIRGLTRESSQTFDTFFTKQITRSLFTDRPPHGPGHDLLSINIQRGRDHGLGTYNDYREFCGLRRARSFDEMAAEIIRSDVRLRLSKLYREVEDIDLFPGGISERSVDGGVAGPTFACIIANAFHNLRKGDRLWYENEENGFTPDQLQQIRKIRLSKILCKNGDSVHKIHPFVFLRPETKPLFAQTSMGSFQNIPVPCESLPDIDLRYWKSPSSGTT